MKHFISYLSIGLFLSFLAACSSGGPKPQPVDPEIAGRLGIVQANLQGQAMGAGFAGNEIVSDLPVIDDFSLNTLTGKADLVSGELIIKFKDGSVQTRTATDLRVGNLTMRSVATTPLAGTNLYRAENLSERQTLNLARILSARPDIEYAVPNYLKYPMLIPDDTNYFEQWHYPAIRMPETWDIVTGTNIVVAVVDTGIFYVEGVAAASHPDLFGKVLPGWDFVSDARNAGDGDSLDANPFDDNLANGHGTHVAGTIAAATNNGRDVAGVNWNAKILPVRVLGFAGGSTLDIMQGALWAAGGSVPGVPNNPNPAQVINMSLGGRGSCTPYEQAIFNQIFSLGAIVVVSAGNENDDANRYSPASCNGVIVVGATDIKGDRARYSNFGPRIDVMAPGGDMQADADGDGKPDGVLSLGFDINSQNFSLKRNNGTSMAAPHVAGVISLMKGVNPALSSNDILTILRNTANPLSPASCQRATGRDCGAGIINAFAAIQAVGRPSLPAAVGQIVAFNPDPVQFGGNLSEIDVVLHNSSAVAATYSITDVNWLPGNPSDFIVDVLGGSPNQGTIPAGGSVTMKMWLDRSKLSQDGIYSFEYIFTVNGQQQLVLGRFSRGEVKEQPTGSTLVASFLLDDKDQLLLDDKQQFTLGGAQLYPNYVEEYGYKALVGKHLVIAWVDENGNAEIDDGDYLGVYKDGVLIKESLSKKDVDVDIARSIGASALGKDSSALYDALKQVYQDLR